MFKKGIKGGFAEGPKVLGLKGGFAAGPKSSLELGGLGGAQGMAQGGLKGGLKGWLKGGFAEGRKSWGLGGLRRRPSVELGGLRGRWRDGSRFKVGLRGGLRLKGWLKGLR